jgi:hypothetical protein
MTMQQHYELFLIEHNKRLEYAQERQQAAHAQRQYKRPNQLLLGAGRLMERLGKDLQKHARKPAHSFQ